MSRSLPDLARRDRGPYTIFFSFHLAKMRRHWASASLRASSGEAAPRLLRRMAAGEGFGEIGLLARSPRTATVTAVTDGTLVTLDGDDFLALVSGAGIMSPFVDVQHGQVAGAA